MPLEASEPLALPSPKRTMIVARENGRLYSVDFSENPQLDDPGLIDWDVSISKILLGKIQLSRTRFVTVEEIEFENVVHTEQFPAGATTDLEVTVFNSIDGKNATASPTFPISAIDAGGLIKLNTRVTGQNFSVQLRGVYNLNTFIVTTHQNGRR